MGRKTLSAKRGPTPTPMAMKQPTMAQLLWGFTPTPKFLVWGFTLIELMMVIAIIAVLGAVVAPQVFRQVEKGRVASVVSFYNSVKTATVAYYVDTGSYPFDCGAGFGGGLNCNSVSPGFVNGVTGIGG